MIEKFKEENRHVINLFELLNRPIDKKERWEFTHINHSNHKKKSVKDLRNQFIYPQLLRVLLKGKKAEKLKEEWKKLKGAQLTKLAIETKKLSVQQKMSLYRGFAMPEYLRKTEGTYFSMYSVHHDQIKSDHRVIKKEGNKKGVIYHNSDMWIWANLGFEILEALRVAKWPKYWNKHIEKHGEEKVNSVFKILQKIAFDLTGSKGEQKKFTGPDYKMPETVVKKYTYKRAQLKREEENKEYFSDHVIRWIPSIKIDFVEKTDKRGRKKTVAEFTKLF